MARTLGTTTWLDLGTTDFAAAQAFYSGLFGWTFDDGGPEFGHYHMVRNGDALVGGAMDVSGMTCPEGDPLPSSWGVYLAVDDVDQRVESALANGGTLVVPAGNAGPAGRFAVVLDPNKADIGLWQAGDTEGYEFTGESGSPVWFENMTHGFDQASKFYTEVFGANLVAMQEEMAGEDFRYVTNGEEESASWGMGDATGMMPEEATGWRVYFGVDSSAAAIAKVQELGGKVLDGPTPSPFGTIATVEDPTGATFQICAMSEAAPEA